MTVSLDMSVLRMLKERDKYARYAKMVPDGTVTPETRKLLQRFGEFFERTEAQTVTFDSFWPFLRTMYPKWKPSDVEFWRAAVKPIDVANDAGLDEQIVRNLLGTELSNKALSLIEGWNRGDEVELAEELRQAVEAFDASVARKVKSPDVVLDWDEMIDDEADGRGLTFRLPCLNGVMKPLDEGAFGIVAMRPDRGKTTQVASEVTFFAPQLISLYPGEFRPVLWLNNEGPGKRILGRLRQSALGMSASEIRTLGSDKARAAYIEAIGGREDMVQVIDIHGWSSWDVEELVRKKNPGVVVFDMIDNIRFTGGMANRGERNDQVLEAMYQWARVLGVKYGFVGLATSQISAEGEGLRWPLQTQLKDSRCLAPGTPIRMYGGFVKKVEDVSIGDRVLGMDSTPRNVLATATGVEPMYRIVGSSGSWEFTANESHILTVVKSTDKPMNGHYKGQVLDLPLKFFLKNPSRLVHYKAVRVRAEYPTAALPMDPYLFGLWLGDGAQRECRITSGDQPILSYLEALPTYRSTYKQKTNCSDVYFGPRSWLDDIGVRNDKHIPQVFKVSSILQRQQLLAGLLDSDGYLDHGTSMVAMSDKRLRLLDDIAEVAASLGYLVTRRTKPATSSASVGFAATDALPCLLPRKVYKAKAKHERMTITALGEGAYAGFTVDGDSRYVLGNYIATHNTGKQGACDFIITGGYDPATPNTRWIGMTKNKLKREGAPSSPECAVTFDADRGRLVMPTME